MPHSGNLLLLTNKSSASVRSELHVVKCGAPVTQPSTVWIDHPPLTKVCPDSCPLLYFLYISVRRRYPSLTTMPPANRPSSSSTPLNSLVGLGKAILFERKYYWVLVSLLTIFEAALGLIIIWKVPCKLTHLRDPTERADSRYQNRLAGLYAASQWI
jgi:hypothetical protein